MEFSVLPIGSLQQQQQQQKQQQGLQQTKEPDGVLSTSNWISPDGRAPHSFGSP